MYTSTYNRILYFYSNFKAVEKTAKSIRHTHKTVESTVLLFSTKNYAFYQNYLHANLKNAFLLVLFLKLKVLTSEMDPAEIRLIR